MQNTIYINNQKRGGTELYNFMFFHSTIYSSLKYGINVNSDTNTNLYIDIVDGTSTIASVTIPITTGEQYYSDFTNGIDVSSLTDKIYKLYISSENNVEVDNLIIIETD